MMFIIARCNIVYMYVNTNYSNIGIVRYLSFFTWAGITCEACRTGAEAAAGAAEAGDTGEEETEDTAEEDAGAGVEEGAAAAAAEGSEEGTSKDRPSK